MTKSKKVILFIVEGITDKTTLGSVLSEILTNERVHFAIVNGDITSNNDSNKSNILKRINKVINRALQPYAFKQNDLLEIVHLIDTDGAFIPKENVIQNNGLEQIEYHAREIHSSNAQKIIARNSNKKSIVSFLYGKKELKKTPYSIFFFSRNIEHVLHNINTNLSTEEKNQLADDFDERYAKKPNEFVSFINSSEIAVDGDYKQTWEFVLSDYHSLERGSNFHLYLNDYLKRHNPWQS